MSYVITLALFFLAALTWVSLWILGMLTLLPNGLLGIIALLGVLVIITKLLIEKCRNKEDRYYEKNIRK